ncbi:hypothetical protein LTR28_003792 [Elasticomyces elasticus]|nr:hypothetical protein LTR28_003792 [Elasticomyces elasticus]
MDNRRQADRQLVHNPNHPPPQQQQQQQQQQPFPSFQHPPGPAQTPVQMPIADPFSKKDPFLPVSSHNRRSSYGVHGNGALGNGGLGSGGLGSSGASFGDRGSWNGPTAFLKFGYQRHRGRGARDKALSTPHTQSYDAGAGLDNDIMAGGDFNWLLERLRLNGEKHTHMLEAAVLELCAVVYGDKPIPSADWGDTETTA